VEEDENEEKKMELMKNVRAKKKEKRGSSRLKSRKKNRQ
jgi:hypothetical protein